MSQLYRTINLSFASPVHRIITYLIGIGFSVILSKSDKDVELPRAINILGWTTAAFSMAWCFYIPVNLAYKDYVYDPSAAADYAAWAPLLWSVGCCWILYVCESKRSGKFTFHIHILQSDKIAEIFIHINVSLQHYCNNF